MNRLRAISIVLLLIIIASVAAADTNTRAVPRNDNFASARSLPVGRSIKVKNISVATLEPSEPFACGHVAHHSVWFTFTPEVTTTLYLSTIGTNLSHGTTGTNRMMLVVFKGSDASSLYSDACGAGDLYGTFLTHTFTAGTSYRLQLGTYDDVPYGPNAFYKLSTRVLNLELNPANRDFETSLTSDNWTLISNGSSDVICGYQAYPALFGNCALKLEGSSGKSSKLIQTVDFPSDYRLPSNGVAVLYVYFRGMYTTTIGKAKITATVVYADGQPPTELTINLTGQSAAGSYQLATASAALKPASKQRCGGVICVFPRLRISPPYCRPK